MDDEPIDWKSIYLPMNLVGIAACGLAMFSSGGLALLGSIVAVACLAGSILASVAPGGSSCGYPSPETDQAPAIAEADEPVISQSQEAGQSRHWRQSVDASRCGGRRR